MGSFVVSFPSKDEGSKIRVLSTEKREKNVFVDNPRTQQFDTST